MSTYFVNSETINAVLHLILKTEGPRCIENLTDLGKSLWMLNAVAVEAAYKHVNAQEYLDEIQAFQFAPIQDLPLEAVLKATDFFLYQCEEKGITEMKLFAKVQARSNAFQNLKNTKAYHAAPWEMCG